MGIDLGGTKIEAVVLDDRDAVVLRRRVPTPRAEGYAAILTAIVGLVRALEAEVGARCSVGMGIPGTLRREDGLVKNANTTCLIGKPLARDLEQRLERTLRIENDANCFAVAEARMGAARGAEVVFGVILGTGVGGGLVLGGQARQGPHGIAGEWGHSPIEDRDPAGPAAPACYCGQHGCIETRLSGPALEADFARLAGLPDARPRPAAEIASLAEQGDGAASRALARYLSFFGEGLARIIHVVDPDVIVLGGGLANMDVLYTEGPRAIERVLFSDRLVTPIRRNALGDSAGVFGAAWLY